MQNIFFAIYYHNNFKFNLAAQEWLLHIRINTNSQQTLALCSISCDIFLSVIALLILLFFSICLLTELVNT